MQKIAIEDIRDTIISIFSNLFLIEPETIHDKLSPDDVENWDSMQHLNLLVALEEEFDIRISPEESTEMLTFGLIALLIEEKLNK